MFNATQTIIIQIMLILLIILSLAQIRLYFLLKKLFFLIEGLAGFGLSIALYFAIITEKFIFVYIMLVIFFIGITPLIIYRRKIKEVYLAKVSFIYTILYPLSIIKKDYIETLRKVKAAKKGDKYFLINGIIAFPIGLFFLIYHKFTFYAFLMFFIILFYGIFFLIYYKRTK